MEGTPGPKGPLPDAAETVDVAPGAAAKISSVDRSQATGGPQISSPFDWMAGSRAEDDAPAADAEPAGRVAERLAFARVTQGLIGRKRWPELGRYEIVRRLGKGAFGSVLLARDPKLDRQVAIKIVSLPSGHHAAARQRVTREARALAALTHPGVVQVYDFGLVHDALCRDANGEPGALFIVMEYLRGDSLRAWLVERDAPPSASDVVRIIDRVAAALAAVHAAGLVHRDVKPDNIMLTLDRNPKLVDFGLVRTDGPPGSDDLEATEPMAQLLESFGTSDGEDSGSHDATPAEGTAVGTVLGTPQYMAPEQHEGRLATQACDQFALAVVLYEALASVMPFGKGDLDALLARKLEGKFAPAKRPVPPSLMAVIERATAANPDDRFPTIEAFRLALATAVSPPRRTRRVVAAASLLALVPVAAVWGGVLGGDGSALPCPTGPLFADLDSVQGTAQGQDQLISWASLSADLDVYAQSWAAARDQVCEQAPASDAPTQARRIACLEHTAVYARTWLSAVLPSGGLSTAEARSHVASLTDPGTCTDAEDDLEGLDAEQRAAVATIERQLYGLAARIRVNVTPETVAQAQASLTAARATEHLPLVAHALDVTGQLQLDLGLNDEANETLTEAVWTWLSAGLASRGALVMPRLLYAREQATGPDGFDELLPLARRVLDEADAPPELRARVGVNIGANLLGRSRFADAEVELRQVKQMLEEANATVTTDYGEALTALSSVARNQGRLDDALALATQALDVLERADGPEAPTTAFAHERVGAIHHSRGEPEAAARRYETAIALLEKTYGPQHPDLAWPKLILAVLWADQGRLDEAAAAADWALQAAEASMGEDNEMIAVMTFNRSVIAEKRDDLDKAMRLVVRSRTISSHIAGEESQDVAAADLRIGQLHLKMNAAAQAVATLDRARASYARLGLPSSVGECRWYLAQAYEALGERAQAVTHAEAALATLGPDAEERAELEAFLGR